MKYHSIMEPPDVMTNSFSYHILAACCLDRVALATKLQHAVTRQVLLVDGKGFPRQQVDWDGVAGECVDDEYVEGLRLAGGELVLQALNGLIFVQILWV